MRRSLTHWSISGAVVAALVIAGAPGTAHAQGTYLFGTMNGTGDLGSSETFTLTGYGSVTATASSGYVLWAKSDGTGETGLGLCLASDVGYYRGSYYCDESGNTDTEIGNDAGSITLSLSGLNAGVEPTAFELASVQSGDHYSYQQGSTCGSLGAGGSGSTYNDGNPFVHETVASTTGCLEFDPVGSEHWQWTYRGYSEYTDYDQGDYLLYSLTVQLDQQPPPNVSPEPASMTLLGIGLAGLAARRRRSAAAKS